MDRRRRRILYEYTLVGAAERRRHGDDVLGLGLNGLLEIAQRPFKEEEPRVGCPSLPCGSAGCAGGREVRGGEGRYA